MGGQAVLCPGGQVSWGRHSLGVGGGGGGGEGWHLEL